MSHSVIIPFRYPDPIEYREVPGFPSYRVGNDGSVWTRRPRSHSKDRSWTDWRKMKPSQGNKGRPLLRLYAEDGTSKPKSVYIIVLEAFVGPRPEGCEGCHFPDDDPSNSATWNLRWDTPKNNHADRVLCGTSNRGERCGAAKFKEPDILRIRRLYKQGMKQREIGAIYGIHQAAVSTIVRRINWKHLPEEENAEVV